jgi:hypothetical protein
MRARALRMQGPAYVNNQGGAGEEPESPGQTATTTPNVEAYSAEGYVARVSNVEGRRSTAGMLSDPARNRLPSEALGEEG